MNHEFYALITIDIQNKILVASKVAASSLFFSSPSNFSSNIYSFSSCHLQFIIEDSHLSCTPASLWFFPPSFPLIVYINSWIAMAYQHLLRDLEWTTGAPISHQLPSALVVYILCTEECILIFLTYIIIATYVLL